jgi:3-hydroxyisobutyrate dehydrogenase-like beta-hydroxyacid dehydrogenase
MAKDVGVVGLGLLGSVLAERLLAAGFAVRGFACAPEWIHVGPVGSGARMKLVFNLVLGLQRAVLAEALNLARAAGVADDLVLQVLRSGATRCSVIDAKGDKMSTEDFRPQARLRQHKKDVALIMRLAEQTGAAAPLSKLHLELLDQAERLGYGDADNSAIIKAFETANRPS